MSEIAWSQQSSYPLLALLQLLPLATAALLLRLRESPLRIWLGRLVALLMLVFAINLYTLIDTGNGSLQFVEQLSIVGPLAYHAGVDGISMLFILLTALIVVLLTLYSAVRHSSEQGRLMAVILAMEGVLMSLLVTTNLLWFILASTFEIALAGYLFWRWSTTTERDLALARFYQFQGTGLLLLLAGALMLGWHHADVTGYWSFDLAELAQHTPSGRFATVIFFLLFYGLAVRTPLFPFHGWLPLVAHHGNVALAPALLLGIKLGIYGMARFIFPLLPETIYEWHSYVAAFAMVGVFYAAFLAFQQRNLRRLMAFAVVSHTSLTVIGLFTLDTVAMQGALILAVNFGLAATALLFVIGFVYSRTRTTALDQLGGLFDRIPLLGVTFLVCGLAIIGMPGTPGFDAAHLVIEAGIHRFGALPTVAATLGNVTAAGFLLWAFQRAFLAPAPEGRDMRAIERATPIELTVAAVVVTVLFGVGFYTEPWLELVEAPAQLLTAHFAHH